ncbi:2-hydroxyglutaryl-CoA dehydratase [Clostridium sp. 19966]|uniref:2-hydroxyglutaryl-CoA dehydratase n=1 Tax=Clostridium sp. 19966 TaxID=2768166 RepID=UPI0028DD7209|nr:2-hydroxyglutaryl-CoA dehydratase [Clostridium sp. 19966]MDT8715226.1 2-hydroxyglutaryl-CoA dehydratase [Clostridium sp. 19966]
MKVSFPNLGNSYVAGKALMDDLGIECIIPSPSNKNSLSLGEKFAPDEICLPFKIMVGNYIEAIEKGADTIIITGSCGPCRYGEYCELQLNILKKIKNDLKLIVVDSPKDIGRDDFMKRISYISKGSDLPLIAKLSAAANALKVINLMDSFEKEVKIKAGFEKKRGECKDLLYNCRRDVSQSKGSRQMLEVLKSYKNKLKNIALDNSKTPIKIAIIGEIYTIIEPFTNVYLEEKLMDYGVISTRTLYPSWWVKNLLMSVIRLNSLDIRLASQKYLPYYIGGHGRECVGEAVLAQKHGCDGAIQIFPTGCMPEIVSKAILPSISKDKDFPIMTLIVDELSGEGGYITRLEAFVDLLERRDKNVLYRC